MQAKVAGLIGCVAVGIALAGCGSAAHSASCCGSASHSASGAPAGVTHDSAFVTSSSVTSAAAPISRLVAHDPVLSSPAPASGRLYLVNMRGWGSAAGRAHQAFAQVYVGVSGVCWSFSSLRGFSHPNGARIRRGVHGRVVVTLTQGRRFRAVGCVWAPHALIVALKHHPSRFYVGLASRRYPGGVVRAQLRGS